MKKIIYVIIIVTVVSIIKITAVDNATFIVIMSSLSIFMGVISLIVWQAKVKDRNLSGEIDEIYCRYALDNNYQFADSNDPSQIKEKFNCFQTSDSHQAKWINFFNLFFTKEENGMYIFNTITNNQIRGGSGGGFKSEKHTVCAFEKPNAANYYFILLSYFHDIYHDNILEKLKTSSEFFGFNRDNTFYYHYLTARSSAREYQGNLDFFINHKVFADDFEKIKKYLDQKLVDIVLEMEKKLGVNICIEIRDSFVNKDKNILAVYTLGPVQQREEEPRRYEVLYKKDELDNFIKYSKMINEHFWFEKK